MSRAELNRAIRLSLGVLSGDGIASYASRNVLQSKLTHAVERDGFTLVADLLGKHDFEGADQCDGLSLGDAGFVGQHVVKILRFHFTIILIVDDYGVV